MVRGSDITGNCDKNAFNIMTHELHQWRAGERCIYNTNSPAAIEVRTNASYRGYNAIFIMI